MRIPYILLLTLGIISPCMASDSFGVDVSSIREQALTKAHEKILDGFELLDIDGNGKLSRRECSGSASTEALKSFPFFSEEELRELSQKIDKAFDTYDSNKDNYLNNDEAKGYISYVENLGLDMQMKKLDKNGDGQITDDEMMSFMQSMPPLEESIAKMKEAAAKLEEINKNSQTYADNFISNSAMAISKEEFSEMDKEHNGQVTAAEYVEYMYTHPNNKELGFSEEDYKNMYGLIDEGKKGYITEQEYLNYNQNQLKDILTDTQIQK